MRTTAKITAAAATLLIAGGIAAGCATSTAHKTTPPPASSSQTVPPGNEGYSPGSAPPPQAAPTTGPVGTAYQISDTGDSDAWKIQLTQVAEPAAPDQGMMSYDPSQYPAGTHLAAAKLYMEGVSGTTSADPSYDLTATDTSGQVHSPTFMAEAAGQYTQFTGDQIGPGEHDSGWVVFQLKDGLTLKSVRYSPGIMGTTVTWTIAR